jgi:hypothetical protein
VGSGVERHDSAPGIRSGPGIATRRGEWSRATRLHFWHQARAGDRHQGPPGGGAGALASGAGRRSPPGGGEIVLSPDVFLGSGIRRGPRTARAGESGTWVPFSRAVWHQARAGDRHQGREKRSCHRTVFWALASGAGRGSPLVSVDLGPHFCGIRRGPGIATRGSKSHDATLISDCPRDYASAPPVSPASKTPPCAWR